MFTLGIQGMSLQLMMTWFFRKQIEDYRGTFGDHEAEEYDAATTTDY